MLLIPALNMAPADTVTFPFTNKVADEVEE